MSIDPRGRKVVMLATEGFGPSELTESRAHSRAAGAPTPLLSPA